MKVPPSAANRMLLCRKRKSTLLRQRIVRQAHYLRHNLCELLPLDRAAYSPVPQASLLLTRDIYPAQSKSISNRSFQHSAECWNDLRLVFQKPEWFLWRASLGTSGRQKEHSQKSKV